jgi:hypothetical protein
MAGPIKKSGYSRLVDTRLMHVWATEKPMVSTGAFVNVACRQVEGHEPPEKIRNETDEPLLLYSMNYRNAMKQKPCEELTVRDFRFLQRCRRDLRCFEILRS